MHLSTPCRNAHLLIARLKPAAASLVSGRTT
jgi:hypothetical protein